MFEFENQNEFEGRLDKAAKAGVRGAKSGVSEFADVALEAAKAAAPVVTGELRDSGRVERDTGERELVADDVVFDADHAPGVHENPESSGYKFLWNALERSSQEGLKKVGSAVRSEIGR